MLLHFPPNFPTLQKLTQFFSKPSKLTHFFQNPQNSPILFKTPKTHPFSSKPPNSQPLSSLFPGDIPGDINSHLVSEGEGKVEEIIQHLSSGPGREAAGGGGPGVWLRLRRRVSMGFWRVFLTF